MGDTKAGEEAGKMPAFYFGCLGSWWCWRKRNRIVGEMANSTLDTLDLWY